MDTCIKNVKPEAWKMFKSEAVNHDTSMGEFFNILIENHMRFEKKAEVGWKKLETGKATLSDKEADIVQEASKEFRKNFECKNR